MHSLAMIVAIPSSVMHSDMFATYIEEGMPLTINRTLTGSEMLYNDHSTK